MKQQHRSSSEGKNAHECFGFSRSSVTLIEHKHSLARSKEPPLAPIQSTHSHPISYRPIFLPCPPFMPRTTKGTQPFNFLTTIRNYACLTPPICTPSHHR